MSRLARLGRAIALGALLLLALTPAAHADHCGSDSMVTPASGVAGTTFVFEANLGTTATVRVFRNEVLVSEATVQTLGPISFQIPTGSSGAGLWRVRAEVPGQTECSAEATFMVVEAPDTAAELPDTAPDPVHVAFARFLLVVAAIALVLALAPSRRS